MAVTYGFFNSVNGDRKYNADQISEYFRGIVSQGVFQHLDSGMAVSAGTGLAVSVAAGRAIIQDRWIQNSAALNLSISAASETYGRKDAVVIRLDKSSRAISITVKTGTPAASPVAPEMTRNATTYEMALAYVNVAAGASSVTVTDKRSDSSVCGWAAVAQATSGEVDQMLNDMKTGFDGVTYASPVAMVQGCDTELAEAIYEDSIVNYSGGRLYHSSADALTATGATINTNDLSITIANGNTGENAGLIINTISPMDFASGTTFGVSYLVSTDDYNYFRHAIKSGDHNFITSVKSITRKPILNKYFIITVYFDFTYDIEKGDVISYRITKNQYSYSGDLTYDIVKPIFISDKLNGFSYENANNFADVDNIPNIWSTAITSGKARDSIYNINRQFTTTGLTIYNYAEKTSSATYQFTFDPIRVRNSDGSLVYNNLHIANLETVASDQVCCYTFDKYGKFLRKVFYNTMVGRTDTFAEDEYFAALVEFPNSTGFQSFIWVVDNVDIDWLITKKPVYYVGAGKDFTTFTSMLVALKDDETEKTVYVDSGEYDIFQEMGGAALIQSITNPASHNWREYCNVVPPNTHIIGLGNVTLRWTPDASIIGSREMAYLFSPLNISGSCTIENINVICKNGRYCIHDEGSGLAKYDNTEHRIINVRAEFLADSTYGYTNAYGSGHNKGMRLYFDSCEFIAQDEAFATHDNIMSGMGVNDIAIFEIKNCLFINRVQGNGAIRLYTDETGNRKDIVKIYNSVLENGSIYFNCPNDGTYNQAYDVTMIGCTNITPVYNEHMTNRVAPKQYNSFSA